MKLVKPANASLLAIASMCATPQATHNAITVLFSSDACLTERLRAAADCCLLSEMLKREVSWKVATRYGEAVWAITLYDNCFDLVATSPEYGIVTVYGDDPKSIGIGANDDLERVERSYNDKCAWMQAALDISDPDDL